MLKKIPIPNTIIQTFIGPSPLPNMFTVSCCAVLYMLAIDIRLAVILAYSGNSLRQTTRDPQNQFLLSDVLLIRIGLLMYTTTAN